jgi:hypothetical protein
VEAAGFRRACTAQPRPLTVEDRFSLPRLTPSDRDGDVFAAQLRRVLAQPW